MQAAVGASALIGPGPENRGNRLPELVLRVLRKGLAGLFLDAGLVLLDHGLPVFGRQIGIQLDTLVFLGQFQDLLEMAMVDAEYDVAEHLDETAVAVVGETRIAALAGETLDRFVIETEVQHRVHHARHGDPSARADGYEQRGLNRPEAHIQVLLDRRQCLLNLRLEPFGIASVLSVVGANLGGDGEARRDRQADGRHLRQIGPLPAQKIAHLRAAVRVAAAKAVDPLAHAVAPCRLDGSSCQAPSCPPTPVSAAGTYRRNPLRAEPCGRSAPPWLGARPQRPSWPPHPSPPSAKARRPESSR